MSTVLFPKALPAAAVLGVPLHPSPWGFSSPCSSLPGRGFSKLGYQEPALLHSGATQHKSSKKLMAKEGGLVEPA